MVSARTVCVAIWFGSELAKSRSAGLDKLCTCVNRELMHVFVLVLLRVHFRARWDCVYLVDIRMCHQTIPSDTSYILTCSPTEIHFLRQFFEFTKLECLPAGGSFGLAPAPAGMEAHAQAAEPAVQASALL
eukprot:5176108-Amphidinium_carterae.1